MDKHWIADSEDFVDYDKINEIFKAVIEDTGCQFERYEDNWWFKAIQERLGL